MLNFFLLILIVILFFNMFLYFDLLFRQRHGPWLSNPWLPRQALRMWDVTSLGGKEADLVHEVEKYRLDIVGPTTTLKVGWTLELGEM